MMAAPKSMYLITFIITLVILFAFVTCETPEKQQQKSPNNKPGCRYNKGTWTECINGQKTRTDNIRTPVSGCEPTRVATKKCKPACKYTKGEWTPCEKGEKTRLLTRSEGNGPECEQTKTIRKQCPSGTKKPRKPNKKGTTTATAEMI